MRSKRSRRGLKVIALLIFGRLSLLQAAEQAYFLKSSNIDIVQNATNIHDNSHRAVRKQERMELSSGFRNYEILTSSQIFERLKSMERLYPNFLTLQSSQELYGLHAAGNNNDCPFDHDANFIAGCKNYIITIEDQAAHPYGSDSWKHLPEVFLSGALHGNERVGPTTVIEVANLLLEAASCEEKPVGMEPSSSDEDSRSKWLLMMEEGRACRIELYKKGFDDASRKWLARLVTTRRIVIMPSPNALGYFRNSRTEFLIDPNRDFPYDLRDSTKCMQTIAGRSINEVFRDHLFQLSLTFHGGMEVIGYEWGAPTYSDYLSPDDTAQKEISAGYSRFAGRFGDTPSYQTGTMNEKVYPVKGGMEDWAYAGSWDPERVIQCQPKTFEGYPEEKTTYNDSTLRALNMLVETSDRKTPSHSSLGSTEQIFNDVDYRGNGHIARNIRLSLLAIDLVQPYVTFVGVNGLFLADDLLLGKPRTFERERKAVAIPKGDAVLKWTVGGGFTVDYTTIFYTKWDDLPEGIDAQGFTEDNIRGFTYAPATNGRTHWHADGADPPADPAAHKDGFAAAANGPTFSATINTSKYNVGDTIAIFAMARVDQGWSSQGDGVSPNLLPTSHVVNARTNPGWRHESAQKIVQGRKEWVSMPLTLVVFEDEESETKDLSNRYESLGDGPDYWGQNTYGGEGKETVWHWKTLIALTVFLMVGLLVAAKYVNRSVYRKQGFDDEQEYYYGDEGLQLQDTSQNQIQ